MNININVNDRSGVMNSKAENSFEDTSIVTDGGPSVASAEISVADDDSLNTTADIASSEVEDLDIGGPPEWLTNSIANALVSEENVAADDTVSDDINDGGGGPTE